MYRKKILIAAILFYDASHNESVRFGRTNQEAAETRNGKRPPRIGGRSTGEDKSMKNFLKKMHCANQIMFEREQIHCNLDFWRKIIWLD
jgi:hypothetical protein